MYHQHQPLISGWARARPENLCRTLQFCIVSARQKFYTVPSLLDRAEHDPGILYGWKGHAYRQFWDNRETIYWHCEDIADRAAGSRDRADRLLVYLASLYGLNVAKAGFAIQMVYGLSGCIDTVNTKRLSLPPRLCANMSQRRTPRGRLRLATRYNTLIKRLGGTARLWDDWCAAMAQRYPAHFPTPDAASALHLECLNIT